jgi:carboxyl-terminal processing protease
MRARFLILAVAMTIGTLTVSGQSTIRSKDDVQLYKLSVASRWIGAYYVDSVNYNQLVEKAIVAMLEDLDPHSGYYTKDEVDAMNEPMKGNFEGIGVQFNILNDTIMVVQTIPGGPSEAVGMMAGDRIVKIDNDVVAGVGIKNQGVFDRLRGDKGTKVTVTVKRNGLSKLLTFVVIRDKIPIYSVDASYMVDDKIGYIKVNRFSGTTISEFNEALSSLKNSGMESLIVDLQGNGGGYLDAAIALADEFLGNDQMIVYTEGLNSPRQAFKAKRAGLFEKGELIILVDESSASASEILAGAVQDWDRGVIVGRRTFGKGLVQRQLSLPDGSAMRLTTSKYYTPSGRLIQKPYDKGRDEYRKDLMERYNHGEFLYADSIKFPDSLKYKTLKLKRTVYGGGGIMPDIFIPIDTAKYSNYHRDLVAKGVVNKVVLTYSDKNRKNLKEQYPTFELFDSDFVVDDDMLNVMIEEGKAAGVAFNAEEYQRSKHVIALQYKALVARDFFDSGSFYRVINKDDDVFNKAVQIIHKGKVESTLTQNTTK